MEILLLGAFGLLGVGGQLLIYWISSKLPDGKEE